MTTLTKTQKDFIVKNLESRIEELKGYLRSRSFNGINNLELNEIQCNDINELTKQVSFFKTA